MPPLGAKRIPLFVRVRGRDVTGTSLWDDSPKFKKLGIRKSPRGNPPLGEDGIPGAALGWVNIAQRRQREEIRVEEQEKQLREAFAQE